MSRITAKVKVSTKTVQNEGTAHESVALAFYADYADEGEEA